MYAFGPGFLPPDHSYKVKFQTPRQPPAPSPLDTHSSNSITVNTADSVAPTDHELISYIFPDFNAVRYFQKDFVAMNEFHLAEETECSGFEIYLVDQWIRSRKIGTVVSAFNGNHESRVQVVKFTIIKKPSKQYPLRFQEYLNEVMLNHATFKKRDTAADAGQESAESELFVAPEFLLVTNISALPSNLNLISIPGGDTRAVEPIFLINSNLRKLNCGGRSLSLIADKVTDASEDKFRQMYRVYNASVPIKFAIRELVNLIQTCLFYFDLLDARYCDGLLCQKTEDAINNWWNLIGLPHFNTKPNSKAGVLPSRTVAAIISLTISVKMRLQMFGGCDVPKDPFDFENFMISIGQFQKQVKIDKKRKLDLITLLKLFYFTNQKFNSDSTKQHLGAFGTDFEDADLASLYENGYNAAIASSRTPSLYPSSSISTLTASVYRRNKLYYSKELKKLTNVVKNTVQDHIIVREDDDNFYSDPSKAKSNKLRSKLASKLSDSVTPADVETIDLDQLVRKHLVGHTLIRLWQGLSSTGLLAKEDGRNMLSSTSRHLQYRHQHHQHHQHHHQHHNNLTQSASHGGNSKFSTKSGSTSSNASPDVEDVNYQFISLRDKIALTQGIPVQHSDKAGRLERMRYALQGKKVNSSQRLDILADSSNGHGTKSKSEPGVSKLDAELQKLSVSSAGPSEGTQNADSKVEKSRHHTKHTLKRRNTHPFLRTGYEASLNTLEYLRNEKAENHKKRDYAPLKKCASFSSIEDFFQDRSEMYTSEKARIDHSNLVLKLLLFEDSKIWATRHGREQIDKDFKHINLELVKLHNMKNNMKSRKFVIDRDYSALLVGRMKDLTDNIDRMAFRSRDLLKKINELEGNSKKFEFKLHQECNLKLEDIVDGLIHLTKFRNVFNDEEERQQLIFQLSGRDYRAERGSDQEKSFLGLRAVIVFIYEIMSFLLQVFNFDRSKMNLDRIRQQYGKLDPNRRYINKAYDFIGRDLVSMLRSGTSETSRPGLVVDQSQT